MNLSNWNKNIVKTHNQCKKTVLQLEHLKEYLLGFLCVFTIYKRVFIPQLYLEATLTLKCLVYIFSIMIVFSYLLCESILYNHGIILVFRTIFVIYILKISTFKNPIFLSQLNIFVTYI